MMPEFKHGQKNVASNSIVPGDQIFRTSEKEGDLMMHVESVSTGDHQGQEVCIWRGTVYRLGGQGSGPSPIFLGSISGERAGKGEWKKPVDSMVTKGVPTEEADYEY
jgi:hypothetical protein